MEGGQGRDERGGGFLFGYNVPVPVKNGSVTFVAVEGLRRSGSAMGRGSLLLKVIVLSSGVTRSAPSFLLEVCSMSWCVASYKFVAPARSIVVSVLVSAISVHHVGGGQSNFLLGVSDHWLVVSIEEPHIRSHE